MVPTLTDLTVQWMKESLNTYSDTNIIKKYVITKAFQWQVINLTTKTGIFRFTLLGNPKTVYTGLQTCIFPVPSLMHPSDTQKQNKNKTGRGEFEPGEESQDLMTDRP